jgi:hypothetical protein
MMDYQAEIKRLEEELNASGKWVAVLGIMWDKLSLRSNPIFKNSQHAHDWLSSHFPVDYYGELTKAIVEHEAGRLPSGFGLNGKRKKSPAHEPALRFCLRTSGITETYTVIYQKSRLRGVQTPRE